MNATWVLWFQLAATGALGTFTVMCTVHFGSWTAAWTVSVRRNYGAEKRKALVRCSAWCLATTAAGGVTAGLVVNAIRVAIRLWS